MNIYFYTFFEFKIPTNMIPLSYIFWSSLVVVSACTLTSTKVDPLSYLFWRSMVGASSYTLLSSIIWYLFGINFKYSLIGLIYLMLLCVFILYPALVDSNTVKKNLIAYIISCVIVWKVCLCHLSNDCTILP